MKPTVFLPLAGVAAAFFLVAAGTDSEQPPPGAAEKIAEALPAEPYAKPAKARKAAKRKKARGNGKLQDPSLEP